MSNSINPTVAIIAQAIEITNSVRAAVALMDGKAEAVKAKLGDAVISQDMVTDVACDAFEIALQPKVKNEQLLSAIATMQVEYRTYLRLTNKLKGEKQVVTATEKRDAAVAIWERDAEDRAKFATLLGAEKK